MKNVINEIIKKEGVFIIAEIGGNHEGNFEYAKRLLLDAASSGVHAVKFQTYMADKIVSKIESSERHKHFKKFELTDEQFMSLANLAKEKEIIFMSSLWDCEAVEKFDPYLQVYKVGSGDITNYPLLKEIAKKNKPIIISTAMSTLVEVKETVAFLRNVNSSLFDEGKVYLLHCVAMYGDPKDEYANLLSIKKLQNEFQGIVIGYSDHTKGIYTCEIAMAIGAKIIEKHFTDDKTRKFRDHHISADLSDMKRLVNKSKKIKILLGKYEKKPISSIETSERIKEFRRGVYTKKDIGKGEILNENNITTLRPLIGISAKDYYAVIGKRVKINKKKFESLTFDELN